MKCTHVCAALTTCYFFTKLSTEPDFPSLGDEIAKPRPDMNIKVAAFTVSESQVIFFMDCLIKIHTLRMCFKGSQVHV